MLFCARNENPIVSDNSNNNNYFIDKSKSKILKFEALHKK